MWSHYLVTLYRSLTRHRLYAALNVLGLAVGIAVFLVLWLDVRFETSFEKWIPDAAQIYTLTSASIGTAADGRPPTPNTMGALLEELKGEYPQLVGARIWPQNGTLRQGSNVTLVGVSAVDADFFKVFDIPLAEGDRALALARPDDVVLTRKMAKLNFGDVDPIGRTLTLAYNGGVHVERVTGVMADPPASSDLQLDFIVPLKRPTPAEDPGWAQWGDLQLRTYLRFANPGAARALDADLDAFTDRHGVRDLGATPPPHQVFRIRTKPLLSLHLSDPKDAAVVAGLGVVGLLTLLLAAVNYVNLATARAGLRAREVAVRKVMGATQPALMAQFMAEAVVTAALGALLGLALTELALPLINAAGGLSLKIAYFGATGVLPVLVGVVAAVGLGAGVYPALVLSRFRPAAVLASARTPGGGRAGARVREGLVIGQFAIAIAFTIATGVIFAQTRFLRSADVGFQRHGLIVAPGFDNDGVSSAQQASLLAAWRSLPDVAGATSGDIAPGVNDSTWNTDTKRPDDAGPGTPTDYVGAGADFFQTYGARLIAGRLPDKDHGDDFATQPSGSTKTAPPPQNAVLNVGAVRVLGFASPSAAVGQPILNNIVPGVFQRLTVIGVVGDIRFRSPRAPVPPTVYLSYAGDIRNAAASVRYTGADPRTVMAQMGAQWRRIAPAVPFSARTAEDNLARYYRPDDRNGRLFTLGAVLAVAIGCVGLYGLAAFNTSRRIKEIGIRKTLGASTADILRLLVGQFLRPVLVANLIAWPLAFLAMRAWLSSFDQRIALNPLYFLAATLLTLAVALATVVGQALAVARAEPARALRHD